MGCAVGSESVRENKAGIPVRGLEDVREEGVLAETINEGSKTSTGINAAYGTLLFEEVTAAEKLIASVASHVQSVWSCRYC